eukprot:scaffold62692_cov56-Attheya_sp.AAC.2
MESIPRADKGLPTSLQPITIDKDPGPLGIQPKDEIVAEIAVISSLKSTSEMFGTIAKQKQNSILMAIAINPHTYSGILFDSPAMWSSYYWSPKVSTSWLNDSGGDFGCS